jgi:hypothetical protein
LGCLKDVICDDIYCFEHHIDENKKEKNAPTKKHKKYRCRPHQYRQYARSLMYSGDRDPNNFCTFDIKGLNLSRMERAKKRLSLGLPISRKLKIKLDTQNNKIKKFFSFGKH